MGEQAFPRRVCGCFAPAIPYGPLSIAGCPRKAPLSLETTLSAHSNRGRNATLDGTRRLRYSILALSHSGVVQLVARQPLELVILVRVQAPEPNLFNGLRETQPLSETAPSSQLH
jgi:hypothetical protein